MTNGASSRRRIMGVAGVLVAAVAIGAALAFQAEPTDQPRVVLLDTDIATDVDDALALASIIGSPELELVGVTTVYGDTGLRSHVAAGLIALSGSERGIPVVAGEEEALSGRPVWTTGLEADSLTGLPAGDPAPDVGAAQFLVNTAAEYPGRLTVVAIGPLTNIAAALELDPEFEDNVDQLLVMGGDFGEGVRLPEHNFASDALSAIRVFESDLDIVASGLDVTTRTRLTEPSVSRYATCGRLGSVLSRQVHEWWEYLGQTWNHPHDPTVAIWLVEPQLFNSERQHVQIMDTGLAIGNPEARTVTVLTEVDSVDFLATLDDRICSAGGATG